VIRQVRYRNLGRASDHRRARLFRLAIGRFDVPPRETERRAGELSPRSAWVIRPVGVPKMFNSSYRPECGACSPGRCSGRPSIGSQYARSSQGILIYINDNNLRCVTFPRPTSATVEGHPASMPFSRHAPLVGFRSQAAAVHVDGVPATRPRARIPGNGAYCVYA
jgi:hypothetical protein